MADTTTSPNMGLIVPTVGVDPGPNWANDLNASLSIIDQHNHSAGQGVQIQPSGLDINSDLSFQNNSALALKATVYTAQSAFTTLDALYVKGVDLYYNDGSGNVIRMTTGGAVNATSSGITDGTATAAFVSSVLVVNAAATTPADIKGGSVYLGNNSAGSKYLKLSPPNAMAANYTLVLPTIPAAQQFVSIDASGNIAGYANVSGGLTTSNLSASAGITGSQIAASTITDTNIANGAISALKLTDGTMTGAKLATSIDMPGNQVTENGLSLIVSSANTTPSLCIIRGRVSGGSIADGEGFTVVGHTTYISLLWTRAFSSTPIVVVSDATNSTTNPSRTWNASSASVGGVDIANSSGDAVSAFSFIAIGAR